MLEILGAHRTYNYIKLIPSFNLTSMSFLFVRNLYNLRTNDLSVDFRKTQMLKKQIFDIIPH